MKTILTYKFLKHKRNNDIIIQILAKVAIFRVCIKSKEINSLLMVQNIQMISIS